MVIKYYFKTLKRKVEVAREEESCYNNYPITGSGIIVIPEPILGQFLCI